MIRQAERIADFEQILEDERFNSVVIGPAAGVGRETQERVAECLSGKRGVVLDADALMSFEGKPEDLFGYIAEAGSAGHVVLTPHEGEFRRLFPDLLGPASTDCKVERTRKAAERAGAVVVLKVQIPSLRTRRGERRSIRAVRHGLPLPDLVMCLPV